MASLAVRQLLFTLVFLLGVGVVAFVALSAIQTVVLPRGTPVALTRAVFLGIRKIFDTLGRRAASYEERDRSMALYAPVALLTLPLAWLTGIMVGFAAMYWALGVRPARQAFVLSGSSLLTLGFAVPPELPDSFLSFFEAGIGLGLLALLITYLPTMYANFSRRELAVAMMEVRAGNPPTGWEMIQRYHLIEWLDRLPQVWVEWERWFVDIEETHTSLPALVFFRSPQPHHSWVTAAGAVLDGASLVASTVDRPRDPEAELCIRAGYVSLRRIAKVFRIPFDPDPRPDDPICIARGEFDEVCAVMVAAGVPLREDLDQAWRDFVGWRVNYDAVLLGLASLTLAPYAPWSSDRSPLPVVTEPRQRRWVRRTTAR